MFAYLIPCAIISIISYSIIKKKNAYFAFIDGAKTSFDLVLTTLPYLVAILVAVELYFASGLNQIVASFLSPVFNIFGIPIELSELIIIKNFSGSGSLAILENIFIKYGADSYIGRCASIIMGSSEAILFVSAVYFSKTKIKNLTPAIIIAIITNFFSAVLSCFLCRFL